MPFVDGASVYGEAEVDVAGHRPAHPRRSAASTRCPNRGRVYARHEFVSSITGPYGLNATERQNTTVFGVDTDYMKDGRLFSEYRIRDAMSGGDAEAAIGLRNLWTLAPGLRLGTRVERVHALSGTGQNENTAGRPRARVHRQPALEGHDAPGAARRGDRATRCSSPSASPRSSNRDWTALARNAYSLQRTKDGGHGETRSSSACRPASPGATPRPTQWNALARVEHRLEEDDTQAGVALKRSTHARLAARRLAAAPALPRLRPLRRQVDDGQVATASPRKYRAQVVGGRATWEFAPRWDVGFVTSVLLARRPAIRGTMGVGLELGYLVATNLWVSAGYNFFGYRDADLAGGRLHRQGTVRAAALQVRRIASRVRGCGAGVNRVAGAAR